MAKLSVEKLNRLKREKFLTNKKISQITDIALVTIDRLFAGKNDNPTVQLLQKVATALECTLNDLMDYENEQAKKENDKLINSLLGDELAQNPEYKMLMDIARDMSNNNLQVLVDVANVLKKNNVNENQPKQ